MRARPDPKDAKHAQPGEVQVHTMWPAESERDPTGNSFAREEGLFSNIKVYSHVSQQIAHSTSATGCRVVLQKSITRT